LLLNYKVGGVGLNLQAANYVFLFDRWWNPAVEDQAVKRAHRLGQQHRVFVKRLYCKDTIEERILKKLKEKRRIFSNVIENIDESRPADAMNLTEEEFFELFKDLKVRPARVGATVSKPTLNMQNLDPKEFEKLVASVYEKEGYDVRVTGRSHDGGIDVEAERSSGGGLDRVIIQCKRQKENVGRPILQHLWGVLSSDPQITRCDLVTSADFSAEARAFAKGKRITLVNGKELKERVVKYQIARFSDRVEVERADINKKAHEPKPGSNPDSPVKVLDENKTLEAYYFEFRAGLFPELLQKLGLPANADITRDMTLAEARRIAARHRGKRS
jgi:restriction endonuclease Mrr